MALIDSSENTKPTQQAQAATQQAQQAYSAPSFSLTSGGLFAAPIPRGVGSEYYTKLKKALLEIYGQANPDVEINVLDLDNGTETVLAYSSIIVAIRYKKSPNAGVAYHVGIVEASGETLQPLVVNNNGMQIEIIRVTSDALDSVLLDKVQKKVSLAFPNTELFYTEGTVIPRTFNPDDKNAVHDLAFSMGLACSTELAIRAQGFRDLNLGEITRDSTLVVDQFYGSKPLINAVQQPVRSDLSLVFSSRQNTNQSKATQSVNAGNRDFVISTIHGYIDLIYNPVSPVGAFNPWQAQGQQMATQKYIPRMIITDIGSNFSYTPGSILFALATALSLQQDNNWIQYFRPSVVSPNEVNLRDVGALNIEANLGNEPSGFGQRIDTSADSFSLLELGQYLSALIQPKLVMSVDCPEAGPQAWYLSVFAAAAEGRKAAYNVIYDSANRLTNGALERYFPRGGIMFADDISPIHLGTWTDRNGKLCDLRDIDYLAVCNLAGDRNPTVIRDFSDTYYRTQYPLDMRLHSRLKYFKNLTNETAVVTGRAKRVTFSGAFMDGLNNAIRDSNINIRVNSPMTGNDFSSQRGVGSFASQAMMSTGNSFFSTAGYTAGNSNFVTGAPNPRWANNTI